MIPGLGEAGTEMTPTAIENIQVPGIHRRNTPYPKAISIRSCYASSLANGGPKLKKEYWKEKKKSDNAPIASTICFTVAGCEMVEQISTSILLPRTKTDLQLTKSRTRFNLQPPPRGAQQYPLCRQHSSCVVTMCRRPKVAMEYRAPYSNHSVDTKIREQPESSEIVRECNRRKPREENRRIANQNYQSR